MTWLFFRLSTSPFAPYVEIMTPIRLNIEQGSALNREVGNLQMSFCKVSPDARPWVPARQELWPVQEEWSWLCALILPHRRTYTSWTKRTFIWALTFDISFVLQGVWAAQSVIKNNLLFWSITEFLHTEHFVPRENVQLSSQMPQ